MRSILPTRQNKVKSLIEKGEFEKLTVSEIIQNVEHCGACNWKSITEDEQAGKKEFYLNPNQQACFNYGRFTKQDFVDWANWEGKIIKGKTAKTKAKFIHYAKAYADPECGWSPLYGSRWSHLFTGKYLQAKNHSTKYDLLDQKELTSAEIINLIYSSAIFTMVEELTYVTDKDKHRRDWREESYGIAKTLVLLGHGEFLYSNTPEILTNLAWVNDTAYRVAQYRYLVKHKNYEFPDVEWVEKNRYK